MTLWAERADKTLKDSLDNCQIAEAICQEMQNISGEAMATGDQEKLNWCNYYIEELRKIELRKFDEITAHTFEYMEQYSKRTEEEITQAKA